MPDVKYTITLSVRDAPGVLVRTAQVFARRGANISSVHITHPQDSPWSQMKITVHNVSSINQITGALEKLVDVYRVAVSQQAKTDE